MIFIHREITAYGREGGGKKGKDASKHKAKEKLRWRRRRRDNKVQGRWKWRWMRRDKEIITKGNEYTR